MLVSGILDRLEVAFRLMASTNWAGNNQVRRRGLRRFIMRRRMEEDVGSEERRGSSGVGEGAGGRRKKIEG